MREGALGSSLKDRSAGTVVRYNYIEASARALDLVEPEASAGLTDLDPSYPETFVYGNKFYNGPGSRYSALLIHYGGDRGIPENYKKGTLYFYNNTVLNISDQVGAYGRYGTKIFDVTDSQEKVDACNNVFYNASYTPGAAPSEMGFMKASEEGHDGNLNKLNNVIRDYVIKNGKILFDFADIESYDPDGNYFLNKGSYDSCDYNGGNWADEWCAENLGNPLCIPCEAAHTRPLNANMKARAFWWMLARTAGWNQ